MKRNFAIVVMVAALALLSLRAFAATVFNGSIPISATVQNPCNGETVTFSGTAHELLNETFDNSGGSHLSANINIHLAGTGSPSGDAYVGNAEESLNENFNSGGTITATHPISEEIISQGSAPNFLLKGLMHITVNPDGTVTSFVDTFTTECKG